jgi:hypothetical protein
MKISVTIRTAWNMLWSTKVLWLFGLLAALGGGGFSFTWNVGRLEPVFELPMSSRALLHQLFGSPETISSGLTLAIVIGLIVFLLHTFAEGALIGLVNARQNREIARMSTGFLAGARYFLRLLIVRVVLALPLLLVAVLVLGSLTPALSHFFAAPLGDRLFSPGLVSEILTGGLAIFVTGLIVAGLTLVAMRAIVIDDLSIGAAIGRSAKLLVTKLPDFLIMTIIFIIYGIVFTLAFAVVAALLLFIASIPVLSGGQQLIDALVFTAEDVGLPAILAIATALFIGMLMCTFASASWTVAYRAWEAYEVDIEDEIQQGQGNQATTTA